MSFIIIANIFDFIVVVVKKATQVKLVVFLHLEFNCVALFRPLLTEHQLQLDRIVFDSYNIILCVAKSNHSIVLRSVN